MTTATEQNFGRGSARRAGGLRIAIPSWRFVGIRFDADPEPEPVSREELQALFHGELTVRSRKDAPLTDSEEREKSIARRIRQALYPQPIAG